VHLERHRVIPADRTCFGRPHFGSHSFRLRRLEINNASVAAATNDAVYDCVTAVATSELDLHQIASRLQQLAQPP
jgi:hypothetical protein